MECESTAFLINIREIGENTRTTYLRENEIRALIDNLSIKIIVSETITIKEVNSSLYMGPGQAEELASYMKGYEPDEVIINGFITPKQEKNLEDIFSLPVSDREAVILAIFYQNARSREAMLQIEKAEAEYMKPRLIAREAKLSQTRGGVRGSKGSGERQLELDRRKIEERIRALKSELAKIREQRTTQKKARERNGLFSFALLGYTNAGKSTILNSLTNSNVLSEDRLFATLDTTTRALRLPNGERVLLSDTVGFIQNLPHSLIEAFKSTLEEALAADAIIVVADASHPDAVKCLDTTLSTLNELNAGDRVSLIVINKIDECQDDITLANLKNRGIPYVITSFKDGSGVSALLSAMSSITDMRSETLELSLPLKYDLSELYRDGEVRSITWGEESIEVAIRVPKYLKEKYLSYLRRSASLLRAKK